MILLEPSRFAETRTPSILPSSTEVTTPVNADCVATDCPTAVSATATPASARPTAARNRVLIIDFASVRNLSWLCQTINNSQLHISTVAAVCDRRGSRIVNTAAVIECEQISGVGAGFSRPRVAVGHLI